MQPISKIYKHKFLSSSSFSFFFKRKKNQETKNKVRINDFGVQYLGEELQKKVFVNWDPNQNKLDLKEYVEIAKEHLKANGLHNRPTKITENIDINNFPELIGKNTLDEHFYRIGKICGEPYLSFAEKFFHEDKKIIKRPKPDEWILRPGWTRYHKDEAPRHVVEPLELICVFDVEVVYKITHFPALAVCMTDTSWYGWVSPFLCNYKQDNFYNNWGHLIPLNTFNSDKLIVGYNVSFDRARVLEEYLLKSSNSFYLDVMSMHMAVNGVNSQQRPKLINHKKMKSNLESYKVSNLKDKDEFDVGVDLDLENQNYFYNKDDMELALFTNIKDDPWLDKSSTNSLQDSLEFHCGIKLEKKDRDFFMSTDPNKILENFSTLMDYCSKDVEATYILAKTVFFKFRKKNPHIVSFSALKYLGSTILPTTSKWNDYIKNSESLYNEKRLDFIKDLQEKANNLVLYIKNQNLLSPDIENDPWISQLDWTIKKRKIKKDGSFFARKTFLQGYPEWYRKLHKPIKKNGEKCYEMHLTARSRITPLLLRLKWEGYPLCWTNSQGWCFKVPYDEIVFSNLEKLGYKKARLDSDDYVSHILCPMKNGNLIMLFNLPHFNGYKSTCKSVMSKFYIKYFQNGVLSSEFDCVEKILYLNNSISYWMGNRARIMDQFVLYPNMLNNFSFFDDNKISMANKDMGVILPRLCTMGTVTRRATENTWLTASNIDKNRIGSELKTLIQAPKGYSFVGADVDSQELWIASLMGDFSFHTHGATALGWMTLEGDKKHKTDMHSKTAEILCTSRDNAKIFNYSRIYGAGVPFASQLLKQFDLKLSDTHVLRTVSDLYSKTKGTLSFSKFLNKKIYHGGSESVMFNTLLLLATMSDLRTPVLRSQITDSLSVLNLNKNQYLTSRINWIIQSSGVDYLHLLIVSMAYLIKRFNLNARLMIAVHDEVKYIVQDKDKYKMALLLQISNLLTRSMFCEQLGLSEIPQSCAFFSEIDFDLVLRKNVSSPCITPSNKNSISPGFSLDIFSLLEICKNGSILNDSFFFPFLKKKALSYPYSSRVPFYRLFQPGLSTDHKLCYLKLQNSTNKNEWKKNLSDFTRKKILKSSTFIKNS